MVSARKSLDMNWAQLVECELAQRKAEGYDVEAGAFSRVSDWDSWREFVLALDALPRQGNEEESPESLGAIRTARRSAEHRYSLALINGLEERLRGGWHGLCSAMSHENLDLTLASLCVLERRGAQFDAPAIGEVSLERLADVSLTGANAFTRAGLVMGGISPDELGRLNPYREGADIMVRSVLYGLVLPGCPSFAAELAWREACLSRRGNGLYIAMFVAATCAAAYVAEDVEEALLVGVSETPDSSLLNNAVRSVLGNYRRGVNAESALEAALTSNGLSAIDSAVDAAALLSLALLYGEGHLQDTLGWVAQWSAQRTRLNECVSAVAAAILGVMSPKARTALDAAFSLDQTLQSAVARRDGVTFADLGLRIQRVAAALTTSLEQ